MRMHKGLNQKGVTLVEIILVIAIIGILASTSVMLIGHLRYADTEKAVKATAEAAGYVFSLPLKQPIITLGNLWDYMTDPKSEFYVRDLFFVKPKDRQK